MILAILAPLASHNLTPPRAARERGVALVLDAPLDPLKKIKLAPAPCQSVESQNPRAGLRDGGRRAPGDVAASDQPAYDGSGKPRRRDADR